MESAPPLERVFSTSSGRANLTAGPCSGERYRRCLRTQRLDPIPIEDDSRTIGHIRGMTNGITCACGSVGCLQTALRELPDEMMFSVPQPTWPDGLRLAEVCCDFCRALGVTSVVLTGGLMNRSGVRHFLEATIQREGLTSRSRHTPSCLACAGAL